MTVWDRVVTLLLLGCVCTMSAGAQTKTLVWIDTDPSVERGGHEVDDGFALIQAFHSPELEIRGVSIVFGNAPLPKAWQIGKEIVEQFGPKDVYVYRGAAGSDDLGKRTDASDALAQALKQGPMNILALGPVTNIATALKLHPELAKNVVRIVAVAGRRPGQHFVANSKQIRSFRDFNFELDPAGFQVLLDSHVPIVLAPWEVSSKVWVTRKDLARLEQAGPDFKYLVQPASDWLAWWQENVGVAGFNPFDTLAVGYVTSPSLFHCVDARAKIENGPDDTTIETPRNIKPYLNVSTDRTSSGNVQYCSSVESGFKEDLFDRLINNPHKKEAHANN